MRRLWPFLLIFSLLTVVYIPDIQKIWNASDASAQLTKTETTTHSRMYYSWTNVRSDLVDQVYIDADVDTCGEFNFTFQVVTVLDSNRVHIAAGFTLGDSTDSYQDTLVLSSQEWLPGANIGAGLPDSLFALIFNHAYPDDTLGKAIVEIKNEIVTDDFVLRGTEGLDTRAQVILPWDLREVGVGHRFHAMSTSTLGATDSLNLSITPSTRTVHLKPAVNATSAGRFYIVKQPTSTGGSALATYNRDHNSTNTILSTVKTGVTRIAGTGTIIWDESLGGKKSTGFTFDEAGLLLHQDTTYVVGFGSTSADNVTTIRLEISEHNR